MNDPGVAALSFAGMALGLLGYPDQALKKYHEALTLAQEVSHPFSQSLALGAIAIHYQQFFHDGRAVQERAEAEIAIAREYGFPFWLARGTMLRGWALAAQGQEAEGIAQIHQGLADWRARGARVAQSYFLATLAETYEKTRQIEEGLTVVAEALTAVHDHGERVWEAELYRLKGELSLKSRQVENKSKASQDKSRQVRGPKSAVTNPQHPTPNSQAEAEAEACFRRAIEISRQQQAKSLELRAVVSLSRLLQKQGKRADARQTLAEIYSWFTEGFDTKDLQEAKALLNELDGHPAAR